MKRFLMTTLLCGLISMPLAAVQTGSLPVNNVQTSVASVPVCDDARIAQQKLSIEQDERGAFLMRTGVYVGAAVIAVYALKKFFSLPKGTFKSVTPKELISGESLNYQKMAEVSSQATVRLASLENRVYGVNAKEWWPKRFFPAVFDMFVQSAAVSGLMALGSHFKGKIFYGKRVSDFFVRSTNLIRTKDALESYADILAMPEFGQTHCVEVQSLLKQRTQALCTDIERVVAYMHIVRDSLDLPSKMPFDLAEQLLVDRTNSALAALWQYACDTEKSALELSRGIALTVNIFERDFAQAVNRFDDAYCLATTVA